jgi:hypothetical protein
VSHVVVDVIDDRVCARRTIVRVRVSERAYAARVCASFVDEHDEHDTSTIASTRHRVSAHVVDDRSSSIARFTSSMRAF